MTDLRVDGWSVPEPKVPALVREWLGPRRWISSGPLPTGYRVAVVSSRLPRLIDPAGTWLQAMRAALNRSAQPGTVALTTAGTAGSEFLRHGTRRLGAPCVVVRCPAENERAVAIATEPARDSDPASCQVDLWCDGEIRCELTAAVSSELKSTPERDRASIAWADEIIVLSLRTGGNVHTLLRERLQLPDARVLLADGPGLQSKRARAELIGRGAHIWAFDSPHLYGDNHGGETDSTVRSTTVPADHFLPCPATDNWAYLTHSTRACPGPWPEQSSADYFDSLFDRRSDANHSPFGTLVRIIRQRRLVASARAIRGGHRVVSFTEVPLADLPRLHVFRSHRARWDFEPYGICIDRDWLTRRGTRPVKYSSESEWNELTADDRPYFQHSPDIAGMRRGRSTGVDWSVEREWRHVGDVDLGQLSPYEAVLFVPTGAEAGKLLEISPWPVTVLETSSK